MYFQDRHDDAAKPVSLYSVASTPEVAGVKRNF